MNDKDYLWDRSGAVDTEIAELEELLGTLRFDEAMPAVDPPAPVRKPSPLWWLAVAAGVGLVIWGWLAREGAEIAPPVARMNLPSINLSGAVAAPPSPVATGRSWAVTMVSGAPVCDGAPMKDEASLPVGGWLETDASSRARIQVADIVILDLEPSSRLRLVETANQQHRVQLERGIVRATVTAPPRVFLVETPNVTAVDLGCEYQLEVSEDGSTWLNVRVGWVSLETKEVVSVVAADTMCRADANGTPGLPLRREASEALVAAAGKFSSGDTSALADLMALLGAGDEATMWHLLSRVPAVDRRTVYDRLVAITQAPPDAAAILRVEKNALDTWGRALGVLPPIGWPEEGPPDPPAPVWQPNQRQGPPVAQPDRRKAPPAPTEGDVWRDPTGGAPQ